MEEQNLTNSDQVSSLNEIINSIKLSNSENNIENNIDQLNSNNSQNNIECEVKNNLNEYINYSNSNTNNPEKTVKLLSNDIDRRIGDYLLNEITKKNSYIEELEEIIKFQESEISQLKSKLESIKGLELVCKLKSNIETKSESLNNTITELSNKDNLDNSNKISVLSQPEKNKQIQVVHVKKIDTDTDSSSNYYSQNQDLVLNANSRQKNKSISKEEEPLKYNGIMLLEKPQKQIVLEQYTDREEDNDKSTEIIKQRRRGARL